MAAKMNFLGLAKLYNISLYNRLIPKQKLLAASLVRFQSTYQDIQFDKLTVNEATKPKPKPDNNTLVFGKEFTDHYLRIEWTESKGWDAPKILPYGDLALPPAASALHYGLELLGITTFEIYLRMVAKISQISQKALSDYVSLYHDGRNTSSRNNKTGILSGRDNGALLSSSLFP
ncbi:branched-chain-amino-acid aminotransferase-like, partial [Actinia tenebrosa]|uniref:Branched-chain-amino-acid aminotransferase-like n=1 Tax=Actinia tenebrosa TaxID=6105 RepID=A0A6P8J0H5_ACTTE